MQSWRQDFLKQLTINHTRAGNHNNEMLFIQNNPLNYFPCNNMALRSTYPSRKIPFSTLSSDQCFVIRLLDMKVIFKLGHFHPSKLFLDLHVRVMVYVILIHVLRILSTIDTLCHYLLFIPCLSQILKKLLNHVTMLRLMFQQSLFENLASFSNNLLYYVQ